MPRTARYIEIEGQFARQVLGTFNIIRGFATLQELAEISQAYVMTEGVLPGQVAGHQRMVDETHAQEIKDYFERGDRQFIPEIILSVRANLEPERLDTGEQVGVFTAALAPAGLVIRRKHNSRNIRIHTLRVDKRQLPALRTANVIRRIDGNHRLAKAHELQADTTRPNQYLVPFCLLLLGPVGDTASDYAESLIFHSINSTAKPLDSEHALQLILGQSRGESMSPEQEFAFNPALHLTRLLKKGWDGWPSPVRAQLGVRPLTALATAAKELFRAYPEKKQDLATLRAFAEELLGVAMQVPARLAAQPAGAAFCRSPFFLELTCHAWMRHARPERDAQMAATIRYLADLATWLGEGGLQDLRVDTSLAVQLVDVYDRVRTRIPKRVFLARWYPPNRDGDALRRANLRLGQIRRMLEDVKRDTGVSLELVDFGSQVEPVIPIHEGMYDAVKSADIILVDLTGHRPNVCVEAGFALRHHDKRRLIFLFQSEPGAEQVCFDLNTYRYEPISEAAEIPEKLGPVVREILREAATER